MKDQYRVVVIGGGVVGASVLYHLTNLGWDDVAIVERSVLTAGSSWHAAGGFHALNADPNIASLQAYTIDLLSMIGEESGVDIGLHMTGGISFAQEPVRWEWLQSAYRVFQTMGIEDVHLMTPDEIAEKNPIIDTSKILGGMWADREGYIDPSAVVHAYAKAARNRGADVIEHNRVLELNQRTDGHWDVVTEKGTIVAENVVNAAGLWAKQVGRMVGLELPVSPLEHHFLISEAIPAIAELDFELPMMIDLDGFTYVRPELDGLLIGIYQIDYKHWMVDGAPWNYGIELLPPDIDRIGHELSFAIDRYPAMETTGIKQWVNGAFTFSPDGNPLVGPVEGLPGYWSACAVMAGFLQGGGVGKALSEWMVEGEPQEDIYGMDIARFGKYAEDRQYIIETTGQFYQRRFVMTYPNEQLWAGRPMKVSPSYEDMTEAGAQWGESWGLEVPIYFGGKGFEEIPSLRRSNAHDIVGAECRAVRENVGIIDITGFSRYEVTGPNAAAWLDKMFATRLPGPGRARLAVMLGHDGRLKGDLTVFNWGDDPDNNTWWIMGSYYLRAWHMRWFHDHLDDGVEVRDISDDTVGFSLAGPKSRELLQQITSDDVSNESFKFMQCRTIDIGGIPMKVGRLSVTGELGYEIHCSAEQHVELRNMLLEAGADLGAVEWGFNAMGSLRLEKSFGIWTFEFRQEYTPAETGMARWIDWNKTGYVGEEAARQEKDEDSHTRELVTLEIDALDADATAYEPVWDGEKRVGYITSGGYGHTIDKSIAMALIDRNHCEVGTELTTHIVGVERPCRIVAPSPVDPQGTAMRA